MIIALQCCVGFCHTSAWIRCRCTCPLPRSPPPHVQAVAEPDLSSWIAQQVPSVCPPLLAWRACFCTALGVPRPLLPLLHPRICPLRLRCRPARGFLGTVFLFLTWSSLCVIASPTSLGLTQNAPRLAEWCPSFFAHLSRTAGLSPCPSCCKDCRDARWGTCVFFSFDFLRVYAQ